MELEEAIKKLKETQDSYLKDELDLAIEKVLQELKKLNSEIEAQKYLIQERDKELLELNQKCILEIVAKEEVEELLENSIPKEKVLAKIKELNKMAKKKDIIPETVKEEKVDGTIVYSQRFNANGYFAEAIVNVLQELLEE